MSKIWIYFYLPHAIGQIEYLQVLAGAQITTRGITNSLAVDQRHIPQLGTTLGHEFDTRVGHVSIRGDLDLTQLHGFTQVLERLVG